MEYHTRNAERKFRGSDDVDEVREIYRRWESQFFPIIPQRIKGKVRGPLDAKHALDEEVRKDSLILKMRGVIREI